MNAVAALDRPDASLRIFDRITPGYIVHASTDGGAVPLIEAGEVAVVDSRDRAPIHNGLFLIEYVVRRSGPLGPESRERDIVRVLRREWKGAIQWWTRAPRSPRPGEIQMHDGPYPNEWDLAAKLLGRVVGIYHPSARLI